MSEIERTCAALAGLLQPLTGRRARFKVAVFAEGSPVVLDKNTYAVPILDRGNDGGFEDFGLLLKTAADATVTVDGAEVEFVSNVGGFEYDRIKIDTELRILDADGPLTAVVTEIVQTATDGPEAGFKIRGRIPPELPCIRTYHGQGAAPALKFFRASVDRFPAAIIAWAGTEMADANTQASLNYGGARVAGDAVLQGERFDIVIYSTRLEGEGVRRTEVLDVVSAVTSIITNRRAVDGQVFSSPGGLTVLERVPVILSAAADFQNVYGTMLRVVVTQTSAMNEYRTFQPWVRTKVDVFNPDANPPNDLDGLPVVENYIFPMDP